MKFQPPKGTRDLLPEDATRLQQIIDVCRQVFEKYEFDPLITPAFESFELLSAKGGLGEAVKDEIYFFKDKSDRPLGLRFDLTMPLARVVSETSLPKPFKRYAIDKVWRYDNPQALRWREFWQADIDVVGSKSMRSDVECVTAICEVLEKLGFKKYEIRVNNRKATEQLIETAGIKADQIVEVFRTIDKMDKIGLKGVSEELEMKGIKPETVLSKLRAIGNDFAKLPKGQGRDELQSFFDLSKRFGIQKRLKFDINLIRGLEYYTGMVYEINLGAKASCGGGGRYDNLIKAVGGQEIPATGISLGLDRILEVMKENKMFKSEKSPKISVINVDDNSMPAVLKIAQELRKNNIRTQVDLMERNFSKQMEYANNSKSDYVLIVGKEEVKKKRFKLKEMKTGKEKELSLKKIVALLK